MAEALEQRIAPSVPAPPAADLRVEWNADHNRESVTITNRGTATADIVDVETIGDPSLLVEPKLPPNGRSLKPGDTMTIRATPSLATPVHIDVRVTWSEPSGTYQSDYPITTV